jgi:hypothetical protein
MKLIEELSIFLCKASSTEIHNVINTNLLNWLEPTGTNSIQNEYSDSSEIASNTQNKTGWNNFIRGRLSLEWRYIMNVCYIMNLFLIEHQSDSFDSELWGTKILDINFKYIFQLLWAIRNVVAWIYAHRNQNKVKSEITTGCSTLNGNEEKYLE